MTIKDQKGEAPAPVPTNRAGIERRRRQQRKNWALLIALVAFAVLFYVITIVRMGHHG